MKGDEHAVEHAGKDWLWLAVLPLILFGYLLWEIFRTPLPWQFQLEWVPSLELGINLYVDGLSAQFLLLITGIGAMVLAMCFLVAGFSLVGVPPSSGFWGKFLLVQEAFAQEHFIWGGFALAVGVLTLYSMVKIWMEGFWKPHPAGPLNTPAATGLSLSGAVVVVLVALLVVIGVYPEPLIEYSTLATSSLWPQELK